MAVGKILVNVAKKKDVFRLTDGQQAYLRQKAGINKAFYVPTGSVGGRLSGAHRNNVINFGKLDRRIRTATHQTSAFIHEILNERRPYKETTLYEEMLGGGRIGRFVDRGQGPVRVMISSDAEFELYYRRCMGLAQSIKEHGLRDILAEEVRSSRSLFDNKDDVNIGVAIDRDGKLLHYKTGHHRLAIAKALGLERIPVSMLFFSGDYVLPFTEGRATWDPRTVFSALRSAAEHAAKLAEAGRPG